MYTDIITRTVKCDGPNCSKSHTFNPKEKADVDKLAEITWLKDFRIVSRGDNQQFGYCSDVCEVEAVTGGTHNFPEKPIVQPATQQDMKQAVAGAAAADALKSENQKVTLN